MSEQAVTLDEFDNYIDSLKEQADLGDKLKRLEKNKDFQSIILNEYLREEALRLVGLVGDPEFQTPEKKEFLKGNMAGIASLKMFFSRIHQFSNRAHADLEEAMIERNRFLEEEGE